MLLHVLTSLDITPTQDKDEENNETARISQCQDVSLTYIPFFHSHLGNTLSPRGGNHSILANLRMIVNRFSCAMASSSSSSTTLPPKRNKRASKKGKKSWRKNTDLDDVEDFLEDKRLEERLGGAFKDRQDRDLFVVDKGEEEQQEGDKKEEEDSQPPERLRRRRELENRPLKCFGHLEITGGVADPKKGRNRRKTKAERENPTVAAKNELLKKQGVVK